MARQAATGSPDGVIAELAARQHGVVARRQLLARGVSVAQVEGRVRRGVLITVHRGVYAVGHSQLRPAGWRLAAVLGCGPGARLSHRAAAAHLQLRASAATVIDVTAPSGCGRRAPGIRGHRSLVLPFEATVLDAVPITTVARTLLDLAEVIPRRGLERAVEEAEALRVFDLRAVERVLDAHPHRHGAQRLRTLLSDAVLDGGLTRSELEERVLAIADAAGIPRPAINARVAGLEVDFYWPQARLVVEADSVRHHHTRAAFERDRARDGRLMLAGLRVLRLTHHRILRDRAAVEQTLRALAGP